MGSFEVVSGADSGTVFSIDKAETQLGRSLENDIVINDSSVSRSHALVVCRNGRFYIRDLGSTHGTFVNEVRDNREMLLSDQDRVRVGSTEMQFVAGEEDADLEGDEGASGEADLSDSISMCIPAEISTFGSGLSGKHAEMLSRVADAIRAVFDIDTLLATLMEAVFEVLEPDRGVILLRETDDGPLVPKVSLPAGETVKVSRTVIDHAIDQKMALLVSDTSADQRFRAAHSIMSESILSAICAPLISRDHVSGVLYIDTQSHLIQYHKEDLALLNIIAANAAMAIENARLVKETIESQRLAAIGLAVAGVSHYVKNVLTGIGGSSDLIDHALERGDIETIRKLWPTLQRSNAKLRGLVGDMLKYSSRRELKVERGDLKGVLQDVVLNQMERARAVGIEIRTDIDEDLPLCAFDAERIFDVVLNLVTNAVEACAECTSAEVCVCAQLPDSSPGFVAIDVVDNGPGISEDQRDKVFQPFYTTKSTTGTGLGLALALKAVEDHGGQLDLASKIGEGTTFRILLPLDPEALGRD